MNISELIFYVLISDLTPVDEVSMLFECNSLMSNSVILLLFKEAVEICELNGSKFYSFLFDLCL